MIAWVILATAMQYLCWLWLEAIHVKKHGKMRKVDHQHLLAALLGPANMYDPPRPACITFSSQFHKAASALYKLKAVSMRTPLIARTYATQLDYNKAHEDWMIAQREMIALKEDGSLYQETKHQYPKASNVTERNFLTTIYNDGLAKSTKLNELVATVQVTCDQEERQFQTVKKEGQATDNTFTTFSRHHVKRTIANEMLHAINEPPPSDTKVSRIERDFNLVLGQNHPQQTSFGCALTNDRDEYVGEVHQFEVSRIRTMEHLTCTLWDRARAVAMQNDPEIETGTEGTVEFFREDGAYTDHVRGYQMLTDQSIPIPMPNVCFWDTDTMDLVYRGSYTRLFLENAYDWPMPGWEKSVTRIYWFEYLNGWIRSKSVGWIKFRKFLIKWGCRARANAADTSLIEPPDELEGVEEATARCNRNNERRNRFCLLLPLKSQNKLDEAIRVVEETERIERDRIAAVEAAKQAALEAAAAVVAAAAEAKRVAEEHAKAMADEAARMEAEANELDELRQRQQNEARVFAEEARQNDLAGRRNRRRVKSNWKTKYNGQGDWE